MKGYRRVEALLLAGAAPGLVLAEKRRVAIGGYLCYALVLETRAQRVRGHRVLRAGGRAGDAPRRGAARVEAPGREPGLEVDPKPHSKPRQGPLTLYYKSGADAWSSTGAPRWKRFARPPLRLDPAARRPTASLA